MASPREADLERRERRVAARESELRAHRPLRRLWWALQLAPLTAIELACVVALVVASALLHDPLATVVTVLSLVAIVGTCAARLTGVGRPR
jgi:hypothetical protein